MFIVMTLSGTGRRVAFRVEDIRSFAQGDGYTVVKVSDFIYEVADTVDEILAQLAGGHE